MVHFRLFTLELQFLTTFLLLENERPNFPGRL